MFLKEHARGRPSTSGTLKPSLGSTSLDITAKDLLNNKRVPLPRYMTQIKDKLVNPKQKMLFKKYSYSELLSLCNDSVSRTSNLPPLALDSKAACIHSKNRLLPCLPKTPSCALPKKPPSRTRSSALVPRPPIRLITRTTVKRLKAAAKLEGPITEWSVRSPNGQGSSEWLPTHES